MNNTINFSNMNLDFGAVLEQQKEQSLNQIVELITYQAKWFFYFLITYAIYMTIIKPLIYDKQPNQMKTLLGIMEGYLFGYIMFFSIKLIFKI